VTRFKTVPDERIKRTVAGYFLKNGLFNGAEYFTIFGPDDVLLYGVEDAGLYKDNLEVFREAQEIRPAVQNQIDQLRQRLEDSIRVVCQGDIYDLTMSSIKYKKGQMDFSKYLKEVYSTLKYVDK